MFVTIPILEILTVALTISYRYYNVKIAADFNFIYIALSSPTTPHSFAPGLKLTSLTNPSRTMDSPPAQHCLYIIMD